MEILYNNIPLFICITIIIVSAGWGITIFWIKKKIETSVLMKSNEKLEKLKSELKVSQEIAMDSIKRSAYEHQITFSTLQTKRFDKIEKLYLVLLELMELVERLQKIKSYERLDDYQKEYDKTSDAFDKILKEVAPYINASIELKLRSLIDPIENYRLYLLTIQGYSDSNGEPPIDLTEKKFQELKNALNENLKVICNDLKVITGASL